VDQPGWGGHWSLAVEEHFYFLWPGALVLLGKTRARWFALFLAISVAAWRMWDLHRHWFDQWIPGLLFGCRTDVRLDALLLGCMAALILNDDTVRAALTRFQTLDVVVVCGMLCGGTARLPVTTITARRHSLLRCWSLEV